MDKGKQIMMSNDCGSSCNNSSMSNDDALIDRSTVKILLWESNAESEEEIYTLLSKFCYQVISVSSAMQIIDVLITEGPYIDIILLEVGHIRDKGMKILNYIMHDKSLQHIAVIMLSTQNGLPLLNSGFKLGAVDYFVKPLDPDDLLNLWMHARRNQHTLGLPSKEHHNG